jgi:hypothetical protein
MSPFCILSHRAELLLALVLPVFLSGIPNVIANMHQTISERNIGNMRRTRATNNPESNNRIFESQNLFQQKRTTMQKLSHIAEATQTLIKVQQFLIFICWG